jgi:hypothetical protein
MSLDLYERLSRIWNFTPEDLEANREGYISDRQSVAVREEQTAQNRDLSFGLLFIVLPALAGCGICFFLIDIPGIIGAVDYLWQIIVGVAVVVGLAVLWSALQGRRATKAAQQGWCDAVDGPLQIVADESRARPRFYLTIGSNRFRIPWRLYDAMQSYPAINTMHRLYFVPGLRYVLSIEPLDAQGLE